MMFRYDYKGFWGYDSHCGLEIRRFEERVVVIATELASNGGTSITNGAESLATRVYRDFDIDPQRLVWIEHYNTDSYQETAQMRGQLREYYERDDYDRVTFDWDGRQFKNPRWKPLTKAELLALLGEAV